jgi:hypothetical protein
MMSAHRKTLPVDTGLTYNQALAYQAPFLIEKLLKERIVETADEGRELFAEVKKFLVLTQSDPAQAWEMYSLRVDEVWHQFILFTRQYMEYCTRHFGHYVHHSPSNAPEAAAKQSSEPMSFATFQQLYASRFGKQPPKVWHDATCITLERRIYNDRAGMRIVGSDNNVVELVTAEGLRLLTVTDIAQPALAFIVHHGTFFVRELPDNLTDEEKTGLVATLVESRIVRVAG